MRRGCDSDGSWCREPLCGSVLALQQCTFHKFTSSKRSWASATSPVLVAPAALYVDLCESRAFFMAASSAPQHALAFPNHSISSPRRSSLL